MAVPTVVGGRLKLEAIPSTDTCNVLRLKFSDIWARMITDSGIQETRESTGGLELPGGCPSIAGSFSSTPGARVTDECSRGLCQRILKPVSLFVRKGGLKNLAAGSLQL